MQESEQNFSRAFIALGQVFVIYSESCIRSFSVQGGVRVPNIRVDNDSSNTREREAPQNSRIIKLVGFLSD